MLPYMNLLDRIQSHEQVIDKRWVLLSIHVSELQRSMHCKSYYMSLSTNTALGDEMCIARLGSVRTGLPQFLCDTFLLETSRCQSSLCIAMHSCEYSVNKCTSIRSASLSPFIRADLTVHFAYPRCTR